MTPHKEMLLTMLARIQCENVYPQKPYDVREFYCKKNDLKTELYFIHSDEQEYFAKSYIQIHMKIPETIDDLFKKTKQLKNIDVFMKQKEYKRNVSTTEKEDFKMRIEDFQENYILYMRVVEKPQGILQAIKDYEEIMTYVK